MFNIKISQEPVKIWSYIYGLRISKNSYEIQDLNIDQRIEQLKMTYDILEIMGLNYSR